MDISISIVIFLIFSYCVWDTESRSFNTILSVTNGGKWGDWGKKQFCSQGHAHSFSIKVQEEQGFARDDTALNGIRLNCASGEVIQSTVGPNGKWSKIMSCPQGALISFSLNVEAPVGPGDDTAANNIQFSCQDGTILKGTAKEWGKFGEWSKRCPVGAICGIETKVEGAQGAGDDTALNDVRFFCCD
ncbi:vitelline membrane outer layer protein 1-like [Sceloporus undulatus]|uniref:vitelline membrane outer layer protein 1-like n=1 Tax=Sceloporus undulatus TaxID=8520 RepID=UPI001C4AB8F9|nr:vitelline membrane outer layer protein 1-like [Sceloporus undulatus]